ncbi:MAG: hypothetical protein FWH22_08710 [Fibromonadales bacterium]|nr:hypothetical protein [Fibromonadales bacterium]
MRAFRRFHFPFLVDILFISGIIGAFGVAYKFSEGIGDMNFILIAILCLGVVVLSCGTIYVLLDMRDSLLKIQYIVSQEIAPKASSEELEKIIASGINYDDGMFKVGGEEFILRVQAEEKLDKIKAKLIESRA